MFESLDIINRRLQDNYGIDTSGQSNWRIVFSEEQFELRYGTYVDYNKNGGFIREVIEWRNVPKYRQWIQEKYVLERLTIVPVLQYDELTTPISYEPVWVFEDRHGNPLAPSWPAARFIIEQINENIRTSGYVKYKNPDANESLEAREVRLKEYEEMLFGNETDVTDHLTYKSGIVVPSNYKVN